MVVPGEVPTTRTLATPAGTIPGADATMVGEGQGPVTEGEVEAGTGGGAEAGTGAAERGQDPATGRGPRGQGAGLGNAGGRRGRRRAESRSRMSRWTTRMNLKMGRISTFRV